MTNKLSYFFIQKILSRLPHHSHENEDDKDDDEKVVKGWSLKNINFVRGEKNVEIFSSSSPISIN